MPRRTVLTLLAVVFLVSAGAGFGMAASARSDGPRAGAAAGKSASGRVEPQPPARTARIALMALGTHEHYQLRPGARVDLVVVSPENRAKGVLNAARSARPGAKVFAYLNTMDVLPLYLPEPASFWKKNEEWFLHDGDGERVRVRVRSYQGERSRYGMNVAHPGWQEYLGRRAVELLALGYDGIQLDNVETHYSYRARNVGSWISALPVEMTEEKWYPAEEELLGRIRKMADEAGFADREVIFNHIRSGEPEVSARYLTRVDGANAEEWMSFKVAPDGPWGWSARVDLVRAAARSGKRTNLLAVASLVSPEEAAFAFASYLMAFEGERNTFWYGKSYRAEEFPWYWFYDADIGAPAGEGALIEGSGVHARSFTKGLVLVNPQEGERTVDLDREYLDEALDPVKRVTLRAKEGKILTVPSGDPLPRVILEAEACLAPPMNGSGGQRAGCAEAAPDLEVGRSQPSIRSEIVNAEQDLGGWSTVGYGAPVPVELRKDASVQARGSAQENRPAGPSGEGGSASALRLARDPGFSGGAAVEFGDTRTPCSLEAALAPGRYRVVVEGRGSGKGADAAFVALGKERGRVAFGFADRQVFEASVRDPLEAIDVIGAEAGVIVDRVVAIRVGDAQD